jgi:hypothetical protein
MRKIAAHYWMRPDGSVGKFPIVEFDDTNTLIRVRERSQFEEEAGLELVNGFLSPAFIDLVPNVLFKQDDIGVKRYFNSQFIGGVRVLGVDKVFVPKVLSLVPKTMEIIALHSSCSEDCDFNSVLKKISSSKNNSLDQLMQFTLGNAKKIGVDKYYGSLTEGKRPGLLAISKVDYTTFQFSKETKLKIIL